MSNEQLSTKVALNTLSIQNIMEQFNKSQEENIKQHETLLKSQTDFHSETKDTLKEMSEKLDRALAQKADKSTVDGIVKFLWIFGTAVGSGILGYIGLQLIKVIENL